MHLFIICMQAATGMREQAMTALLQIAGDSLTSADTNTLVTVAQATENLIANPQQISASLMVSIEVSLWMIFRE